MKQHHNKTAKYTSSDVILLSLEAVCQQGKTSLTYETIETLKYSNVFIYFQVLLLIQILILVEY